MCAKFFYSTHNSANHEKCGSKEQLNKLRYQTPTISKLLKNTVQENINFKSDNQINNNKFPKTHIGEKLYRCLLCPRSYIHKGRLNVHMKSHTGIKKYKCEACTQRFYTNKDFDIHIRSHTGFKPYKCLVCRQSFRQQGNLKIHQIKKHNMCRFCNTMFSDKEKLDAHKRHYTQKRSGESAKN